MAAVNMAQTGLKILNCQFLMISLNCSKAFLYYCVI
jgi:hypothetical protein